MRRVLSSGQYSLEDEVRDTPAGASPTLRVFIEAKRDRLTI